MKVVVSHVRTPMLTSGAKIRIVVFFGRSPIGYYNADRPHSVFGGRTPDEVYATQANEEKLAA